MGKENEGSHFVHLFHFCFFPATATASAAFAWLNVHLVRLRVVVRLCTGAVHPVAANDVLFISFRQDFADGNSAESAPNRLCKGGFHSATSTSPSIPIPWLHTCTHSTSVEHNVCDSIESEFSVLAVDR